MTKIKIEFDKVFPWPIEILFWLIIIGLVSLGIYVLFRSLKDNKIIKKYKTKAYDLCICSRENIIKFYNEIGYVSGCKKDNRASTEGKTAIF